MPGRNESCPCGSGRKFKHCCLAARTDEDRLRLRVRAMEGRVVDTLIAFTAHAWDEALVVHAWESFWNYEDAPKELTTAPEFEPMFLPWLVLGFVPDPEHGEGQPDWPVQPIGFVWLETSGARDDEREYIETACRSPLSVVVVEQVDPGRSLDIKDILTGRRFHVLEQGASQRVGLGDLLFTRVVTWGGASVMFGLAPYAVPAAWHTRVIDFRESLFGARLMTRQDLEDYDIEIRDLYFLIAGEILNPTPPALQNTDGDPLEPTELTYALSVPIPLALEKLRPLAEIGDESHVDEDEHDASGTVTRVSLSWVKAGNAAHRSWSNTVLGSLRLADGQLVAEVNSRNRATRLQHEIDTRLGPGATLVETKTVDVAEVLAAGDDALPDAGEDALTREAMESLDVQAMLEEHMRLHWEGWLATRIPALGNKTPRQAAKTVIGRERLEALLHEAEHRADNLPDQAPHIARVRVALGLPPRG